MCRNVYMDGGNKMANKKTNGYDDEEMTVELELDDGQVVNCAIITILTVGNKDYIVLLPLDENGEKMARYGFIVIQKMNLTQILNRKLALLMMMMNMNVLQMHLMNILIM